MRHSPPNTSRATVQWASWKQDSQALSHPSRWVILWESASVSMGESSNCKIPRYATLAGRVSMKSTSTRYCSNSNSISLSRRIRSVSEMRSASGNSRLDSSCRRLVKAGVRRSRRSPKDQSKWLRVSSSSEWRFGIFPIFVNVGRAIVAGAVLPDPQLNQWVSVVQPELLRAAGDPYKRTGYRKNAAFYALVMQSDSQVRYQSGVAETGSRGKAREQNARPVSSP